MHDWDLCGLGKDQLSIQSTHVHIPHLPERKLEIKNVNMCKLTQKQLCKNMYTVLLSKQTLCFRQFSCCETNYRESTYSSLSKIPIKIMIDALFYSVLPAGQTFCVLVKCNDVNKIKPSKPVKDNVVKGILIKRIKTTTAYSIMARPHVSIRVLRLCGLFFMLFLC